MRHASSGVPVMRIVADTNTVLSGPLWQGPAVSMVTSPSRIWGAGWPALRRMTAYMRAISSSNSNGLGRRWRSSASTSQPLTPGSRIQEDQIALGEDIVAEVGPVVIHGPSLLRGLASTSLRH